MANNDLLSRLQTHLSELQANPNSLAIDVRLFDSAELVLPDQISQEQTFALIQQASALLQTIQQDATPAINLLIRLLDPFRFSDVLAFDPPVDFAAGLELGVNSGLVPFNRLMLVLLSKAESNASDAAIVASRPEILRQLVRLWLYTPETGVATQACAVLLGLLKVDRVHEAPGTGQGMVAKRLFGDEDVYALFFDVCSLKGTAMDLSKGQRTLAQARLLEWLPKVAAMDWSAVCRSHHEVVEKKFDIPPGGGLLDFAVLKMVDYADDVLMYRCLIDFYSELLELELPRGIASVATGSSPALEYLVANKIHGRTAELYLQTTGHELDIMESMFLYGPAANYIAKYASSYTTHYQKSGLAKKVNGRLMSALDLSSSRWAHAESPKHDLHLLASVPRATLLPETEGPVAWSVTPLSLIPSKTTNPDALNTLAIVFHGPHQRAITFPAAAHSGTDSDTAHEQEKAAARALYLNYVAQNPRFWSDVVKHADTVALMDHALAAENCLTAVITANWSTKPAFPLPTNAIATPAKGHLAILSPPALEYALPYLLSPPKTFSNLVGGRGDTESAAYKIAAAKYDALRAMHSRLESQVQLDPGQGYEDILMTIAKSLAQGPMSREGEVGGQIATMDL
jgi:hypothetical protein